MILTFATGQNWLAGILDQLMAEGSFNWIIEYCNSLPALESKLRRPHPEVQLILISINTAAELIKLFELRALLLDMKLIIGLPYRNDLMAFWAFKLGPRFIAYAGDDYFLLGSVIKNILQPL